MGIKEGGNMKKIVLVFALALVVTVFAGEFDMELGVHRVIDGYWNINQALTEEDNQAYAEALNKFDAEMEALQNHIAQNNEAVEEFKAVLENLPEETRHIFNSLIKELESTTRNELFPGYGYAEPGYHYRRGGETGEKELLQKFWKSEERTFESNKRYKFYIELKLATQMQQNAEVGGVIEGFNVKGVVGMIINGEFKEVAETEFLTKETLRTKCVVAYEKNKVHYELYRAKKGFWDWLPWTSLTWEKVGTTYVILEEATETSVMLEAPNF